MNAIMRGLAAANGVRARLGAGEPGLYPLLGGWGSEPDDGLSPLFGGGGQAGAYSRVGRLRADTRVAGGVGGSTSTGGTQTPGGGCADQEMVLPGGLRAGDITTDHWLELVDPITRERRRGRVTLSVPKLALRFLLVWKNGVELVCSDTAPIPTADSDYCTPLQLCGEQSLTELGGTLGLSPIVRVERRGMGWVQHITCENACFLVGRYPGAYALHHNAKDSPFQGPQ